MRAALALKPKREWSLPLHEGEGSARFALCGDRQADPSGPRGLHDSPKDAEVRNKFRMNPRRWEDRRDDGGHIGAGCPQTAEVQNNDRRLQPPLERHDNSQRVDSTMWPRDCVARSPG